MGNLIKQEDSPLPKDFFKKSYKAFLKQEGFLPKLISNILESIENRFEEDEALTSSQSLEDILESLIEYAKNNKNIKNNLVKFSHQMFG